MANKQQNKPRLVYVAEDLSMSPLGYKLVKAIFEDDEEGIENVRNRRIETTPALSVIDGFADKGLD